MGKKTAGSNGRDCQRTDADRRTGGRFGSFTGVSGRTGEFGSGTGGETGGRAGFNRSGTGDGGKRTGRGDVGKQ